MRSASWFLALFLAGFCGAVSSAVTPAGPFVQPSVSGGRIIYPGGGAAQAASDWSRSWAAAGGGGSGATVRDLVRVVGSDGKDIFMAAERSIGRDVIKAAARVAVKAILPLAIGYEIWNAYKAYGVQPNAAGAPVYDPGTEKIDTYLYYGTFDDLPHSSAAAAQYKSISDMEKFCGTGGFHCGNQVFNECTKVSPQSHDYRCVTFAERYFDSGGAFQGTYNSDNIIVGVPGKGCPEGPAVPTIPIGNPCSSKVLVPATDTILDRAFDSIPNDKMPDVARQLSSPSRTDQPGASMESSPAVVSGPASSTPTQTTTTNPDGTTSTTTTTNHYSYSGDQYTTTTTTTTNINGQTTVTQGPPPVGECQLHPDTIGCASFGEPSGPDLPRKVKDIAFERVVLGGGGSCPADVPFTVFGELHKISYEPICAVTLNYIRPIMLVCAAAAACLVFIGGLKA